jgi:hypothetical protein
MIMHSSEEKICTIDGKNCFKKSDFAPMIAESLKSRAPQITAMKFFVMLRPQWLTALLLLLSVLGLFEYGNDGWLIVRFIGFAVLCIGVFVLQALAGVVSVWFMPMIFDVLIAWTGVGYNWLTLLVFAICAAVGLVAHLLLWFGAGGVATLIATHRGKAMLNLSKQK